LNVTGQQSQVLAGEYLPASRIAANPDTGGGITLPSGGAVLQRVTVVTSRPDDTVVLLRADYSPPPVASSGTYEKLSANARFSGDVYPNEAGTDQADTSSSTRFPAAAQYAKAQHGSAPRTSSKGGVIDVYA
jgi:hypothetical protein